MSKTILQLEIESFENEPMYYFETYLNGNKNSVIQTLRNLKGTGYYDLIMLQFIKTPDLYQEVIKKVNIR